MSKVIEDRPSRLYQFYPSVAAVVVVKFQERINAMSVAWNIGLSTDPPLFGVLIAPKRYTHELIERAEEFSVNFLPADKSHIVAICGRISGREMDKLCEFNIGLEQSIAISSPVMKDAFAAYECKLYSKIPLGDHTLFVGEILKLHYQKDAFRDNGIPELAKNMPNLYLGADTYLFINSFETRIIDKEQVQRMRKEKK